MLNDNITNKDKVALIKIRTLLKDGVCAKNIDYIHCEDVCLAKYKDIIDGIMKINYTNKMTMKKTDNNYNFVMELYKQQNYSCETFKWIIPFFMGTIWWVKLEIYNLEEFINTYYSDHYFELAVIDLNNQIVFSIEEDEDYKMDVYLVDMHCSDEK